MGRFASTADLYERARQPYGAGFFVTLVEAIGLRSEDRLLDLGTGPGLLALGFAPFVGEVWGVDPEPTMLAAARANAERAGRQVRLIEGTAETVPDRVSVFDAVTIGRALHWMDPEGFRAALDRVVAPAGVVLVCTASTATDGRNPWLPAYDAVRERWSESGSRARFSERDAYFCGSRFCLAGEIVVETRQEIALPVLADRVLSMSSTSPDRLGNEAAAMTAALTSALEPFARSGRLVETVVAKAEVFRPTNSCSIPARR